jgi:hypothetical protein
MIYNPYRYAPYAAAAAQLGVPSQVSNRFAAGRSYTRTVTKKRKTAAPSNSVKSQMLKAIDNHHLTMSDNNIFLAGSGFTSGTLFCNNLTAQIVQGTGNSNRVGDKIHLNKIVLRGCVITPPSVAGAYSFRVMLVWSSNEYNPAGLGAGLTFAEIFLPNTGSNNITTAIANPKACTVIYDKVIDVNSLLTTVSDLQTFGTEISLSQDFVYENSAGVYGKNKNLYLVVSGFVAGGTLGTTALGTLQTSADVVFKPF